MDILNTDASPLSEKPRLGKNRPGPVLVWKNPKLSADVHREKSKARLSIVSGQTLYAYVLGNPINWIDPNGLDPLPGINQGRQYLAEANGDSNAAWERALNERIQRNWESSSCEGKTLREAENYLFAYKSVAEGDKHWYGVNGARLTSVVTVPLWQGTHVIEQLVGASGNSAPSYDALAAGYQGSHDAVIYMKR